MDEGYSLGLSLVDFIPNLAFLVGAFFLVRSALLVRGRKCGRMVMAGTALVFLGGMLKATWKLLYTIGAGDVRLLSEVQFVLLAAGFLAMLVAAILIARGRPKEKAGADGGPGLQMLPAMAAWKIPFLAVMTICSIGALGVLAYAALRRRAAWAGTLFVAAAIFTFAMAGMASAPQTVAMQWVQEGANSAGQIAFAGGSYLLYRHYRAAGGC